MSLHQLRHEKTRKDNIREGGGPTTELNLSNLWNAHVHGLSVRTRCLLKCPCQDARDLTLDNMINVMEVMYFFIFFFEVSDNTITTGGKNECWVRSALEHVGLNIPSSGNSENNSLFDVSLKKCCLHLMASSKSSQELHYTALTGSLEYVVPFKS